MLSAVLHSDTAVDISTHTMNAFVAMRHFLLSNAQVFQRLDHERNKVNLQDLVFLCNFESHE